MDSVDRCKDKLASLRIIELKEILTQLGISKQGKKQDLVDRIVAVLADEQDPKIWTKKKIAGREQIAKLVNDAYRKMQVSGGNSASSKGQDSSDGSSVKINGVNEPFRCDRKVRCPCGSSLGTESVIKCEDKRCCVWQHIRCVIIPETPMDVNPPVPSSFYCEICRLNRADPFWVTVSHPLYPVKLTATNVPTDGSNPFQSVERTFHITRADKDMFMKPEYDIQVWCMLLNDKVQFRMQWPQYTDLQVNGIPIRATNRPGQQLLGANGRDDGAIITPCTKEGINKISLTGCDARIFCLGVRIVKRLTLQQVLKLIPKEGNGECYDDALARVRRCVGGGNEAENADSDSDIEVVADFITVNLRCPMSGSRMKTAGRFKPCAHMGCFDLEVFVELNQRSKKWQCPICLKNYSLENIIIDPYFNRITSKMNTCGEDMTEVEVKPDGSWRVKFKTESDRRELQDLAEWHLPDSILASSVNGTNPTVQTTVQIKVEDFPQSQSDWKLGTRTNTNGWWGSSKPKDMGSSGNRLEEKLIGCNGQNIILMSNSATGSGRDEDRSVNQDGGEIFDFGNNGIELESTGMKIDPTFGFSDRNLTAQGGTTDVIILTDSDEENVVPISSGSAYDKSQTDDRVNFPLPSTAIADSFPVNSGINGGTSSLNICNGDDEDFGMHLWQSPSGIHGGQGFQLFTTDAASTLVDLQHKSNTVPSVNGYLSGTGTAVGSTNIVHDSIGQIHTSMNDNYNVYQYLLDGEDPSLQIFLPTRPSVEPVASQLSVQADASNGLRPDDWISLRLGGGAGGSHDTSTGANGLCKPQQIPSRNELYMTQKMPSDGVNWSEQISSTSFIHAHESAPSVGLNATHKMPSVEASGIPKANDKKFEKANNQRSDNPFSFPRQKRSVRPRLFLSIDSGSE